MFAIVFTLNNTLIVHKKLLHAIQQLVNLDKIKLSIKKCSMVIKRIIKPTGVTTIKNTAPITIGDTIEPKRIPNLNHSLFNGVKNFEFKTPKTKKTKDKIKAHNLKSP